MTVFSLQPAYVVIDYTSDKAPHEMTRPTREWTGTPFTDGGSYIAWDESIISAPTMIEALVDAMLPLFTEQVTFTGYSIYTQAGADADPVLVHAGNFAGKIGSSTSTAQYLAYAKTYTYVTTAGHAAKLVLLDVPTGGIVSKSKIKPPTLEGDLVDIMLDAQYAWSGRDDARIIAFRSVSNDVNDALQKKYNL